jgi:hypothetical protein
MAKKNFQRAPKPSSAMEPEHIEAFEQGGVGNDKGRVAIKPAQEQTKRLSIDLPEAVHQRFKTACSATSRKMTQEIEAYIIERTAELEKEAGIIRK